MLPPNLLQPRIFNIRAESYLFHWRQIASRQQFKCPIQKEGIHYPLWAKFCRMVNGQNFAIQQPIADRAV